MHPHGHFFQLQISFLPVPSIGNEIQDRLLIKKGTDLFLLLKCLPVIQTGKIRQLAHCAIQYVTYSI